MNVICIIKNIICLNYNEVYTRNNDEELLVKRNTIFVYIKFYIKGNL